MLLSIIMNNVHHSLPIRGVMKAKWDPPPKECLQPVQNSEFLREFSNLTVRREGGKSIFNDVTFNWETFFLWITWTVCCPGVDACRCCNHAPSRGKFPFHPALRYCDQHCQLQITPKPNDLVFLVLPQQHNFSWTSANEELNKSHYIQSVNKKLLFKEVVKLTRKVRFDVALRLLSAGQLV